MLIPALLLMMQSATPGVYEPDRIDPQVLQQQPRRQDQTQVPKPDVRADTATEDRFDQCLTQANSDPASGVVTANGWLSASGGYFARHCLGFAYARQANWPLATSEFEKAASEAGAAGDPMRSANLWAQAGNAALAGEQYLRAISFFDTVIAGGALTGQKLGEAHLDKARALVALNRTEDAKAEFAAVHELVPQDPLGWLLSATLARREGDLQTALSHIAEAAKLAPQDADIALEAGNIAVSSGDYAGARTNWQQAVAIAPDGEAAMAAQKYLAQLEDVEKQAGAKAPQ